ncbi:HAD family hydrolase [Rhizobium rhizogenes]|uniref:HAD family hydrolase n=1 Tax=Rhizobium rhizogenes TaxID=359 RepID=UPI0015722731|nr:HAD family hydrolase [Rhizobium rhizogenes]NTF41848.1 HAD family hydrolase [Rhizobium rhizogenes]
MIEAVMFDLDETLIDRRAALKAFLPDQFERFRDQLQGVTLQAFEATFLALEKEGLVDKQKLYPRLAADLDIDSHCGARLLSDFQTHYPHFAKLSIGALETLVALRVRGLKTAIISNGHTEVQSAKIEITGLRNNVDLVVISEDVGLRKPDPRIFQLTAERLGVTPARCIFVGDNPEADVIGAQASGMTGIFYNAGTSWPDALPFPKYSIETLVEVLSLIEALA